jgi:hypothetical protein
MKRHLGCSEDSFCGEAVPLFLGPGHYENDDAEGFPSQQGDEEV